MQLTYSHTAANQHAIYDVNGIISSGWQYLMMTYQGNQSVPVRLYWDIEGTFQLNHSEEVGLFDCKKTDLHVFPVYIAPQTKRLQLSLEFEIASEHSIELKQVEQMSLATFLSLAWSKKYQSFCFDLNANSYSMSYNRYRGLKLLENKRELTSLENLASAEISEEQACYLLDENEPPLFTSGELVSVVIPVFNVNSNYLLESVQSVKGQSYRSVECIVVVHSDIPQELEDLLKREGNDIQLVIIKGEDLGTFAHLVNQGIKQAKGTRLLILHPDDLLSTNSVAWFMQEDADIVYCNEVYVNSLGQFMTSYQKPNWSPELLLAHNYLSKGVLFKMSVIKAVGEWNSRFEHAAEYDYYLRSTEQASSLVRIKRFGYKQRLANDLTQWATVSTTPTSERGKQAIEEALIRRKLHGNVTIKDAEANLYSVSYHLQREEKISIIICTRDQPQLLDRCLTSIFEKTDFPNYEVIVVDNGSREEKTFQIFNTWKSKEEMRFKVVRDERPFNFSALNNQAVRQSSGTILVLLNNDIEVISRSWLNDMAGYAIQEDIGAVGALLYYGSGHVQHAGAVFNDVAPIHSYYKGWLTNDSVSKLVQLQRNFLAVTGACLMVKRTLYEAVGGLEEAFESSYNDMHFCMELYRLGKRNLFIPEASLYHHESISRGRLQTIETQEEWMKELGQFRSLWGYYFQEDPYVGTHTY